MPIPAPLKLHRDVVRPEWIDYNGHMNVAYYVLAFDRACDAFLDFVGLDEGCRARTGGTTFAVDCHVTYQREVARGDPLSFATQLLDHDEKRIRHFHWMHRGEDGFLAATCEWMSLHIDLESRRVAPMPPEVSSRLAAIMDAHRILPRPPEAGRAVGAPRSRN